MLHSNRSLAIGFVLALAVVASACKGCDDSSPTSPTATTGNTLTVNLVTSAGFNMRGTGSVQVIVSGPTRVTAQADDNGQAVLSGLELGSYTVNIDGFGLTQGDIPTVVVDKPTQSVAVHVSRINALRISPPTPGCGTVPYGSNNIQATVEYSIAKAYGDFMQLWVFLSSDGATALVGKVGTSFNGQTPFSTTNPVGPDGRSGSFQAGLGIDPVSSGRIKTANYIVATLQAMNGGLSMPIEGEILVSAALPCAFAFQ